MIEKNLGLKRKVKKNGEKKRQSVFQPQFDIKALFQSFTILNQKRVRNKKHCLYV